jgi:hypothetical protein
MNKIQAERLTMRIGMFLSVVLLILVEIQMARILNHQRHTYFQALGHKDDLVYFIAVMVFLTSPLLLAWIRTKEIEKKMKQYGADKSTILHEKNEIYGNLTLIYLIFSMCINSLSDLIR